MKYIIASLAIGTCLLLPSGGIALGDNLHDPAVTGVPSSAHTGQSGSNVLASCSPGGPSSLGLGAKSNGTTTQTNEGGGSPFNLSNTKEYAGNAGNPTGTGGTANNNSHAVAQYDVACAQAQLH
jgi:hypothetical protein